MADGISVWTEFVWLDPSRALAICPRCRAAVLVGPNAPTDTITGHDAWHNAQEAPMPDRLTDVELAAIRERLNYETHGDDPSTWAGTPWWHIHRLLGEVTWLRAAAVRTEQAETAIVAILEAERDEARARLDAVLALCDEIGEAAAYGAKVHHPANHGQHAHDIDRIAKAARGEAS